MIYCKRNNLVMDKISMELAMAYGIYVAVNSILTFFGFKVTEALAGIGALPSSNVYTIVAVLVAVIVPYIQEIIKKYFEVKVEIKKKDLE
jgi:uncharacterized membrane protein